VGTDPDRHRVDPRCAGSLERLLGGSHDAVLLGGSTRRRPDGGTAPAHGWVVDDHLVYAALLFGLDALGAGRILGLDTRIEQTEFVQKNGWLRWLLG
jgi:hypothetical protein